jgi:membrane associated rhomboid family serine protease
VQKSPPIKDFRKYAVVTATCALAITLTLAWWGDKIDAAPLFADVNIRRGELWRLITCTLLHANVMHLAFDVYWTWVFGTLIEAAFGSIATLGIFILLAAISSAAEFAFLDGGIGLSGIGYGLFGLLWVLSRRQPRFATVIDQNTIVLFVVWFFICIALTVSGQPIANIAHGAGAAAGATLGFAITAPAPKRWAPAAGLGALLIAVLLGSTLGRPWINLSKDRGEAEGQIAYDDLQAGRNEDALRWLRDAVRMQPTTPSYWFNMGIAYDRFSRQAEASAAYHKAFELDPSDSEYKSAAESDGN